MLRVLTLNELEATSGFLTTVFLSFLDTGVSSKEAFCLERRSEFRIHFDQGTGNSKSDRTGLTSDSAAIAGCLDIVLAFKSNRNEWALNENVQHWSTKVVAAVLAIDQNFPFARLELWRTFGDRFRKLLYSLICLP
jgi:hypothetical protein